MAGSSWYTNIQIGFTQGLPGMVRPTKTLLLTLVLLGSGVTTLAAGVLKWTDANGQVHYGDSPPPGYNTQPVRIDAPPPSRNPAPVQAPAPVQKPAPFRSIDDERQARIDEVQKRNREGMAALVAARERTQALNDKALMDRCRAARDSYCDQGVNVVRQKNYEREQMQAAAQQGAAMSQGRVIPPAQRIQPTAPCQWPQTCTGGK
jgi:Domain of unknown function (DUF4124)